jgi:hypothetical protein
VPVKEKDIEVKVDGSAMLAETDPLLELTEVYKSNGFDPREAVEKAEAELKERRAADERKERRAADVELKRRAADERKERRAADAVELKKLALQNQLLG